MKGLFSIQRLARSRHQFASYRAPGSGGLLQKLRSPGPALPGSDCDPRCAGEALAPLPWNQEQEPAILAREAKMLASAYILKGRGPSVERH